MPLREAKSIDTLAAETREADLTLSADPPLTLALDRHTSTPRLGRASATPRSHAANEFVPSDRRRLFTELITQTDLTWKQAHRALDRCLQCWDATGSLDTITDYPEFDTPQFHTARDILHETDSSYHDLEATTLPDSTDLAVINEAGLSPLDRTLLPDSYQQVDPFTGDTTSLPQVHIFPSTTAIVDALITQLDTHTGEAVGIVLDESSLFSPLVESALETAGIPYQGGPGFIDDPDIRTFLRLAEAVFTGSDLRVADLRPLVERLGVDLDRAADHRRVDRVDVGPAYERFVDTLHTGTVDDAIATYERAAESSLTRLREECARLGLLSTAFTPQRLTRLRYYLESFDIPADQPNEGVLLTDGAATSYIDRPVVFYLGLGDGWAQQPPDRPWVDPVEHVQQDLDRFEILLQNGQERHFLVQASQADANTTPCVYFQDLVEHSVESFSDLPHTTHGADATRESVGTPFVAPDRPDTDPELPATISQSTLQRLANCPRAEFFHRLVESPTTISMARGTVIHEAAELCVTHPGAVREHHDAVIDAMLEQIRAYATTARERVERTQCVLALETIQRYLDAHPPTETPYESYSDRSQSNRLAERLGLTVDSSLTERWFQAPGIGLHGFVDLLHSQTALIDYKTGSQSSPSKLRQQASLDPLHDEPNFQAAAYLAQHRRETPGQPLEIRFVHLLEHDTQLARGDTVPLADLVTSVEYLPCTFGEFAARRETFDAVTDYVDSNDRVKALDPLGYDAYREFFEAHDLPREGVDPERREAIIQSFIEYTKPRVNDTMYVERGCRSAVEDIDGLVGERYLTEDLNAFEAFVTDQRERLAAYRKEGFPVCTHEDGPNWDRVDARDLVIDDV
ncbi:PD-(D/E)XK nuclease family protein [Halobaculum gomorrense]|uniref:PD-(D/E)XK nuclease superfamily protein n=1 Tax=Halobaculum gomorrense TaxID=43928 RepID=A0A1M5PPH8_9EURY|nr:PD-(D/E)XK nuclease family protein [Halobaculum gomorrense]SHH03644.1 PD-(D/E)XK nuclease superfamily protein [Halobaculum gomorrense]